MLNTKDILGYLKPFSAHVDGLIGVSIPNEINTLSAEETVGKARAAGMHSMAAQTIDNAIQTVIQKDPNARILLCGSLYLAGEILRQNNQPKSRNSALFSSWIYDINTNILYILTKS